MRKPDPGLDRLIELGDLDELTREVDRRVARRDWDGLVALRDRCRAALERGKQLWPVAAHAEYRLALEAPGPWAGSVVVEGAGRFAFGPLAEVAASTHSWEELAGHVPSGPLAAITAHERVVRGEDVSGDGRADPHVLPIPLALAAFETGYVGAEYHPDRAEFPTPAAPELAPVELPPMPAECSPDVDEARALRELATTWLTESNGRAEAVAVAGDALVAIAALGVRRARVAKVPAGAAFAWMVWAAASGGAEGRRRGMAWGRYLAWECASILLGVELDEVPDVVDELDWFLWDGFEPATGWALRLAVHDPADGVAWAVSAFDQSL